MSIINKAQDWMLTDAEVISLLMAGVIRVAIGHSSSRGYSGPCRDHQGAITMAYFLRPAMTPGNWTEVASLNGLGPGLNWYERSWGTGALMAKYEELCNWELVQQRWQAGKIYQEPLAVVRTHISSVHRVV